MKQLDEKTREKKHIVNVGFMGLKKEYDRVNREALWKMLRMYGTRGKLINVIKSIHANSLACIRL